MVGLEKMDEFIVMLWVVVMIYLFGLMVVLFDSLKGLSVMWWVLIDLIGVILVDFFMKLLRRGKYLLFDFLNVF